MIGVSEILETIIKQNLFNERKRVNVSLMAGQSVIALSIFFILLGVGFFIYAIHLWLISTHSTLIAAYYTGMISLGLAFFTGCVAFLAIRYRQARIKSFRHKILEELRSLTTQLDDELGDSIRKNPKMAMLIGSFMGFLFEDRIR